MGAPAVINLQYHNPDAAVERYFIDVREKGRLDLVPANVDEHLLDLLGIVHAFHAALVVHAKDYYAAARVCQGYDFRGDLFRINQPNLEFDVGIFTSANQVEEISSVQRPAVAAVELLLEHRPLAPWTTPARSEFSAVCHTRSSLLDSRAVAQSQ